MSDPHKEVRPGCDPRPTSTPTGAHPGTPTGIVAHEMIRAEEKLTNTLTAKLALIGAVFTKTKSGSCTVSCAGVTRHFDSHDAVETFLKLLLRQIGREL